ncbi:MAG TPA: hypothetical protein EYQ64_09270 [Gemmatimonadetes bacterium]|nr:hypothetical protein [Gemmatimonadota bacterium]
MVLSVDDGLDLGPEPESLTEIDLLHDDPCSTPGATINGGRHLHQANQPGPIGNTTGYPFRMSILAKLAFFFVIVPLVELALLIKVGQVVGFWPTIGLVVFTGAAGAWLARLEGLRTMFNLRDDLAHGRLPGQAIMDGADHIVVGRPIWQAEDPAAAARAVLAELP